VLQAGGPTGDFPSLVHAHMRGVHITRKTAAMQLLSDEEFTLEQVRDECIAIGTLIEVGSFGQHRDHLLGEAKRIQTEACNA
jgi:hypothetical protein